MYKILYLPTAEYLVINTKRRSKIIRNYYKNKTDFYSLSAPRSLIKDNEDDEKIHKYKLALFTSKLIASSWLSELINRSACKDLDMRLEYFEFIKVP